MCEFKVYLEGEQVAEDVIFAREDEGSVTVRDILGDSSTFKETRIKEVDVFSTRLLLSKIS